MGYQRKAAALVACMLAIGVASMPQDASAQCDITPLPQQTALSRPIPLGISGGNINSFFKNGKVTGCFSGTLGSMVQDTYGNQYILSNNHVLADQNKAKPGQLIVEPGLIDVECLKAPSNAVATFSRTIRLKFGGPKNTVDAAIAAVEEGEVSSDILNIGEIASSPATPTLGMSVQKMGRTSCLTSGVIAALDGIVKVNYSEKKKPKMAKFINQIFVTGSTATPTFSAAGDSGSLILSQGDCPQPVALLFAGFADGTTIANPISEVLSDLGVSMVGSCTTSEAPATASADVLAANVGMSKEVVASAAAVRDRHEDQLMSIPGAVGTAIGIGDQPGQPAIEVYLDKLTPEAQAGAPKAVEGIAVKLIESGEAVAY
ncbi:MAG TPA: hypothetical protein VIO10_02710 [Candidatus Binatus sp.]